MANTRLGEWQPTYYSQPTNINTINEFTTFLDRGKESKEVVLNLRKKNISLDEAKTLAALLESGRCPVGLEINLAESEMSAEAICIIIAALESGNCPSGLRFNLQLNQSLLQEISFNVIQSIAKALESNKCPQDLQFILDENYLYDNDIQCLTTALKKHRYPAGLCLSFIDVYFTDLGGNYILNLLEEVDLPDIKFNLFNSKISKECFNKIVKALTKLEMIQGKSSVSLANTTGTLFNSTTDKNNEAATLPFQFTEDENIQLKALWYEKAQLVKKQQEIVTQEKQNAESIDKILYVRDQELEELIQQKMGSEKIMKGLTLSHHVTCTIDRLAKKIIVDIDQACDKSSVEKAFNPIISGQIELKMVGKNYDHVRMTFDLSKRERVLNELKKTNKLAPIGFRMVF